jgi:autotransporter-associated beta strand protein
MLGAASKMEPDPMRLAPERRAKLIERLGRKEDAAAAGVVAMPQPEGRRMISWVAVAAAVAVLAIVMGAYRPAVNASKSAAIRQMERMKLAEMATAGHPDPDLPATVTTAPAVQVPMSLVTKAPEQAERLAALDALKAQAGRKTDDLDDEADDSRIAGLGADKTLRRAGEAPGPGGNLKDKNAFAYAKDVPSDDMSRAPEYDYSPEDHTFAAYGDFRHQSRAMIAGNDAVQQQDALAAEKQLGVNGHATDAAGMAGELRARSLGIDDSVKGSQAAEAEAPAVTGASMTLSGANSYAGATTVSGGALATASLGANPAYANSVPPVPPPAMPSAPVAATAAAGAAEPSQDQLADRGGAAVQGNVAEAGPVQLADIPGMGPTGGQARNEAAKEVPAPGQRDAQLQSATQQSVAQQKGFGIAGGGDASGADSKKFDARFTLGTQTSKAKVVLAQPTSQMFAFNLPQPTQADLATRMLHSAQKPATGEVSAADQPYSTFSLHVSDVSFLLAKAALAAGRLPDSGSIRPEEFYNAFDYGDPAPGPGQKIACRIEQAEHPLLQQRNLVRIAMKVADAGRGQGQPLRLTVLLDTSGSMEREDRAASVQKAMRVLASLLGPNDAVTLIGFARQPRLLAEEVPGDRAGKLVEIVKHTPAEGGTNMEEALRTASELALRHYDADGQNRVVMLTDGATNLGDADPAQLAQLVEGLRQQGVSFDACGVGADGLNDDILEALTRKGGGRYYFLNRPEDADEGFARQLAGAFHPAAENVKMQVRFNPDRVGKYRLIGFEKHRLNQEDFRNDKVTAAQLAAEEAAVALYQVQVLPEGEGEIGEVFVRFRDTADGRTVEQSWTIPYDAQAPAFENASSSMQLAATASLVAEKLRGGPAADAIDLDALAPIVGRLRADYPQQARVQDLVAMFEQVRHMTARK